MNDEKDKEIERLKEMNKRIYSLHLSGMVNRRLVYKPRQLGKTNYVTAKCAEKTEGGKYE